MEQTYQRTYIHVDGIGDNSCFVNRPDPDRILRAIEIARTMQLKRLTGMDYDVKASFVPADDSSG